MPEKELIESGLAFLKALKNVIKSKNAIWVALLGTSATGFFSYQNLVDHVNSVKAIPVIQRDVDTLKNDYKQVEYNLETIEFLNEEVIKIKHDIKYH